MKLIKKYWKLIIGAVTGIFALLFIFSKKNTNEKLESTKKKIDTNNIEIVKIDEKIESIKQTKSKLKKTVKSQKLKIETKKTQKSDGPPKEEVPTSISRLQAAKSNILKRSRK